MNIGDVKHYLESKVDFRIRFNLFLEEVNSKLKSSEDWADGRPLRDCMPVEQVNEILSQVFDNEISPSEPYDAAIEAAIVLAADNGHEFAIHAEDILAKVSLGPSHALPNILSALTKPKC